MINVGQTKTVEITDVNHLGKGVSRVDDFVIFVDGAIAGDKVICEIKEVKKTYAIGKIIKFIQKSKHRAEPICEYFEKCGGCQIMHMEYQEQLKYKKQTVANELRRAGIDTEKVIIQDIIGMEKPWRYRNKTVFFAENRNSNIRIGTYEQESYKVVDIDKCMLQSEKSDEVLRAFRALMNKYNIEPYNKRTGKGTIRSIIIRNNQKNEIMVVIITSCVEFANKESIVKELTGQIKEIKTIVQNINKRNNNLIMGDKNITLFGHGTITDKIKEFEFTISPHTFFQINSIQTEKLYDKAIEYASLNKDDICFDLYSGIGTISLMASKYVKKVYGVEEIYQSVKNARDNAKLNKIKNVEFYTGKTEEVLPKLNQEGIKADVIIVDPPRKGCDKIVIDTIIEMAPQRVVYISCNPSTMARDVKILQTSGYVLKEIQPIDAFCQSVHTETVALLSRKNPVIE